MSMLFVPPAANVPLIEKFQVGVINPATKITRHLQLLIFIFVKS